MGLGRFAVGTQLALGVMAALILIAVTSGIADGALNTERAQVNIPGDGSKSVGTACKRGTRAISGGFDAPGSHAAKPGAPTVLTFLSTRVDSRKWTTFGSNTEEVAGRLVGYLYCSDALPRLGPRSGSETIGLDEAGTATAECPQGSEAVSGGFITQNDAGDSDPFPFESRRVGDRQWQVSAINFRPEPVTFTAIAYCAKHRVGLKVASRTATNSTNDVNLKTTARCKRSATAVSGGFSGEITSNFERETYPFRSMRKGGRGWSAGAYSFVEDGESVDWRAFAYCLDKDKL